ncbi:MULTISPECIES: SDR family NAD(P)-dependent oxidoreductase [Metabacillus]|uniref:Short-chain dehydrogenase n=1 Tax=Metabacillus indicus TaxID=246786 RepID=A0A084H3B2_METID|nr:MULTISPECIES: SDR family oxidoreductase [Metabacillus]KEZ54074.1 short-chain dehydrogenase [Metabacillus indicus]
MRFQNQIAVVTGGGSGIGLETARKLASEGAKVILAGRSEEKLKAAAEQLNHSEQAAFPFAADVTKEEDVLSLLSYVKEEFGDLHILVNNAGGSVHSRIMDTTAEQWDFVQNVNLKSVFLVSKVLGGYMAECSDEGNDNRAIVNVASLSGHKAGAEIPHYSAAKAAVIHFTRALAHEFARNGIRVNSVSPGFIETPLTEQGLQNARFTEAIKRNTALKRVGKPEEIANIIAFAASHEASYMTGSDLLADGGWLIT